MGAALASLLRPWLEPLKSLASFPFSIIDSARQTLYSFFFGTPKGRYDDSQGDMTDTSNSPYYKSYTINQVREYTEAFHRDGFVVVDGVLSADEIALSKEEVWQYLQAKGDGILRDRPETWDEKNWPKEICRNGGFMGRFPYIRRLYSIDKTMINKQPQAWRNRQNPKVYNVFRNLLDSKKLWVSLDRYGIMRPTKVRVTGDERKCPPSSSPEVKLVDKSSEWATKKEWLHWDLNPFHFATSAAGFGFNAEVSRDAIAKKYGWTRVQGLVTITDCPEPVGGFHCVKGFQGKRFEAWRREHMETYGKEKGVATRNFVEIPSEDPMRREITKVPIRAGSLLVWNSQLPHGNFPNSSERFRMVQYIKMIPVEDPREFQPILGLDDRRLKKNSFFPNGFTPSDLGARLFGIKPWE
eukprot:jgi/Bigna1/89792/estExt_fgenesh1_pg.C_550123